MTNYIIIALCIIVLLSYVFDITSKYSKIPGVILLILLGIGIQLLVKATKMDIPNMKPILPVIGTLGLILIIMEASLDLKLEKRKKGLIIKSISSAFILLMTFSAAITYIMVEFFEFSIRDSLLNIIPLGIISSSVAIPSAIFLNSDEKEFIVYESSFSDTFGIIIFDFVLISTVSIGKGILNFALNSVLTIIIALITTSVLAILLHKIRYHINYVIIMTSVVMVYMLAKLSHLPALLLVLTFGLVLSNNKFLENTPIKKIVDFDKFRNDVESFKKILTELTFIVRSFFFLIFGYYTQVEGLFNMKNIITALSFTSLILVLRLVFFKQILKMPVIPLFFFTPRGLITILLFLSIPVTSRIPLISEEVITLVIFLTIVILMIGNIIHKRESVTNEGHVT
jgi:potassium/hydrogen antiporter